MLIHLKSQRGTIALIAALVMTALCGFAALVADAGVLYMNRIQLSNAADSAALAGAQELPRSSEYAALAGYIYAWINGKWGDDVSVAVANGATVIHVDSVRNVELFFARILGFDNANVRAAASVQVKPLSSYSNGIVPFGIVKQNFSFGQTYRLKFGAGDGYHGNYAGLALGGTGSSVYRDNIKFGYNGPIKVGDWIPTETGNMTGPTKGGVDYRVALDSTATFATVDRDSGRIVIVPVIDSLLVNGRNEVLVVGFAAFFLEGVGGGGQECYVEGKFMRLVVTGDVADGAGNYGAYSAQLVR